MGLGAQDAPTEALEGALEADRVKKVRQKYGLDPETGVGPPTAKTIPKLTRKTADSQDDTLKKLRVLQEKIVNQWDYNFPGLERADYWLQNKLGITQGKPGSPPTTTVEQKKNYMLSLDPETFFKQEAPWIVKPENRIGGNLNLESFLIKPSDEVIQKAGAEAAPLMRALEENRKAVRDKQAQTQSESYSPQSQMFRAMPEKDRPLQVGNIERGFLDNLKDLGIEPAQWKNSMLQAFDALGLKDNERARTVPYEVGLRRALEVLDPNRVIASQILGETKPKPPVPGEEPQQSSTPDGAPAIPSRQDKVNQELDAKRDRMRELFQELKQRHFMTTWGGIISFILLALATRSPVFAAQIMLRLSGHDAVEFEIKGLQREIEEDQRQSDREEDRDLRMRSAAAQMILRQSLATQADDRYKRAQDVKVAANDARAARQEMKDVIDGLEHDFDNYNVLSIRAAKEVFDPLTGEMKNPKSKEAREYLFYKEQMDKIQKDIEKLR